MKVTYKIVSYEEAAENNYPLPRWEEDWEDVMSWCDDYRHGIWRFENEVPVEWIGSDGGEPEDNTLYRDWAWIDGALEAAYALGKQHGIKAEFNRLQDKV